MHSQDDSSMSVKIAPWSAVWACAADILKWKEGFPTKQPGPDLSQEAMPPGKWAVTVVVGCKGSVSLHFTLDKMKWEESSDFTILNAARAICILLDNCG
jgi:hypothetical protein